MGDAPVTQTSPVPSHPGTLAYAATPHGHFRKLGNLFTANKVKWQGMAIASPDAIYLLKQSRFNSGAAAGAAAGGLVGALIGAAISAAIQKPDDAKSCTYFQLPDDVRNHPDWPARKIKKDIDVVVVPKAYVAVVKHPRFSNLIKFSVAGVPVVIEYGLFTGKKTRAFLAAAGWPLQW